MRRRVKRYTSEESIHLRVARFIQTAYPKVIFRTDFASGMKMTIGQARKHKSLQSGRAYPDLFIAEPVGQYHGLYIELKRDGVKLKRTRPGTKVLAGDYKLRMPGDWFDLHTEEQAEILKLLNQKGYVARFAVGQEEAERLITAYLQGGAIDGVQ